MAVGKNWKTVDDGRMRFEKSHPWHFSGEGRTEEEMTAYANGYSQIDWSDGPPNQARIRKTLPKSKAHRSGGF